MNSIFNGRLLILTANSNTDLYSGAYKITAYFYDNSNTFSGNDIQVNYVIADANATLFQITAYPNPSAVNVTLYVNNIDPNVSGAPVLGNGMIFQATPNYRLPIYSTEQNGVPEYILTKLANYESTQLDGIISGTQGATSYTNAIPTPVSIGGIAAGTTFSNDSMTEVFNMLLYPYQTPAFTSFGISGQANPLEVGASVPASITFTWSTSNSSNIQSNSISIRDTTLSTILGSGLANTGNHGFTITPITNNVAATHSFGISATNTESNSLSANVTYSWEWRKYYGANANDALTADQVTELASSQLSSGIAGTYSMGAGGYKYICVADVLNLQINSAKDQSTNLNIPFAYSGDGNPDDSVYSNVDGGGFYYAVVSGVTNINAVATNYRIYRTLNSLGSSINIVIS